MVLSYSARLTLHERPRFSNDLLCNVSDRGLAFEVAAESAQLTAEADVANIPVVRLPTFKPATRPRAKQGVTTPITQSASSSDSSTASVDSSTSGSSAQAGRGRKRPSSVAVNSEATAARRQKATSASRSSVQQSKKRSAAHLPSIQSSPKRSRVSAAPIHSVLQSSPVSSNLAPRVVAASLTSWSFGNQLPTVHSQPVGMVQPIVATAVGQSSDVTAASSYFAALQSIPAPNLPTHLSAPPTLVSNRKLHSRHSNKRSVADPLAEQPEPKRQAIESQSSSTSQTQRQYMNSINQGQLIHDSTSTRSNVALIPNVQHFSLARVSPYATFDLGAPHSISSTLSTRSLSPAQSTNSSLSSNQSTHSSSSNQSTNTNSSLLSNQSTRSSTQSTNTQISNSSSTLSTSSAYE